jgi:cell division protein FtsQ
VRTDKRVPGRQNRKKRSWWLRLAMLMAFFGALSAGFYYAKNLRMFELKEIVIYGNEHFADKELNRLMGIEGGEDLLMLSPDKLAFNLLSSPWVVDVGLRKEFPHRLLVRVSEAEPAALLQKGDKVFLIDDNGKVLGRLNGAEEHFLPVMLAGKPTNQKTYEEALQLARVVKDLGLSKKKKLVEITGLGGGPENLGIRVEKFAVKLGEGGYREKLSRLFDLSGEIERKNINVEYVDLRFADRVVVKSVKEVIR